MKRRDFIALAGASALAPFAAHAMGPIDYTPGIVAEKLAAGETVFLDFKASWCSTCARQERIINTLRGQNPDYDAKLTFVNVDWDEYGRHEFTRSLNIPRRSTLVALKGDVEIGRIVANTLESDIKALLDAAVAAAGTS